MSRTQGGHLIRGDALVLFGATGDLARKKLLPALYRLEEAGRLNLAVVGVALTDWDDERFRLHAREAVTASAPDADPVVLERLATRLSLISGDYAEPATFHALAAHLRTLGVLHPVFYLAIPPSMFPGVVEALAGVQLARSGRVVVEKPFGRDLSSARHLNEVLHEHVDEDSIFRIDHYLGKEPVEGLLVFRFANTFLDPIWNRNYVSSVQVTLAEDFGVEGRGSFYDGVGAIRDVLQNHVLQVVAMLAMEPPVSADADALRDEKVKVLRAMRPLDCSTMVRGQYVDYRNEPGVAEESTTETFVAARLEIDSWRWSGVPFFVRAGKALATTALEAVIELKDPPRMLFADPSQPSPHANVLRFRLGRSASMTMSVEAKRPGQGLTSQTVELDVDFEAALGRVQEAYERLLDDAIEGNPARFAREDGVEAAWRIVQPAIDEPGEVHAYDRGTWGPAEADAILDGHHWHEPTT